MGALTKSHSWFSPKVFRLLVNIAYEALLVGAAWGDNPNWWGAPGSTHVRTCELGPSAEEKPPWKRSTKP